MRTLTANAAGSRRYAFQFCESLHIRDSIDKLRTRSDVGIVDERNAWRIVTSKGRDYFCEVTVPHDVLEWFACVKRRGHEKEEGSDWMDYCGYDNTPLEKLELRMAEYIAAFVDRVSSSELRLPLQIHEKSA